jgi:hypothetical protein
MDSGSSEISKENAPDTQPSSDALDVDGLADERQVDTGAGTKLASELASFFNAVDRVVTMMRVYPMGHPLLDGLIDNLHSRLSAILEREDAIFVNLDATELTTADGIPCFSEELAEKDEFIWYAPYSDGLLQLEFRRGLEADELRSFLRVINRAAVDAIFSDDDTVTLLWELQLDHIKYFAVEGFVDAGELEDFGERTEQEAVDLIADAAIEPNGAEAGELDVLFDNLNIAHLDLFTRMQVEANAKVIVPELRDQDLAYAFAVDESLVDRLCDEWMEGSELEYRLIEALLSVIRVAPGTAGASRAAEMIESLVLELLESQSFQQAVRILELLHERRELFFDTEVDPLGELVTKLSDPMQIEALVNIFQRRPGERESITRLFLLLGRDNVLQQILGLLADDDRNVVALPQLVDIIFELVDESTETLITAPKYVEQSTYLRRLMSELPDRDFVDWRPTTRLIRRAIDDPDPEVRELGLMLDHPCWDDAGLAQNYLVPMADDADERIRKLALEQLGDKHPELFQEAIRDTILARKMGGRGHAELRFLMRVFLESSPDAPEYLRSLLDTKGWIGKGSREFAKMAAAILIESGDQAGIAKIQEACDSLLTSPELKRSYESSLRRFGGESSVTDATAVPVSEPSLDESSRAKPTSGGPLDPIPFDLDSEPEPASQPPQPSEPSEPDPDGLDDGISVPWWDESEEDA